MFSIVLYSTAIYRMSIISVAAKYQISIIKWEFVYHVLGVSWSTIHIEEWNMFNELYLNVIQVRIMFQAPCSYFSFVQYLPKFNAIDWPTCLSRGRCENVWCITSVGDMIPTVWTNDVNQFSITLWVVGLISILKQVSIHKIGQHWRTVLSLPSPGISTFEMKCKHCKM